MDYYNIKTGSIVGSAVAVGPKAKAVQANISGRESLHEVTADLDRVILLLEEHRTEVPHSEAIGQFAVMVKEELAQDDPDVGLVHKLLARIAAGVSAVGALAEAITKIQDLISHVFK